MNDRLLKESDVLNIAFQLPLVVNSTFYDAVKALPSADRPQEVIAQVTFDEEKLRKIVKETIERFKKEYEVTDRPQGAWITVWDECGENENGYECSECRAEVDERFPNCPYCLARMKGIDDE